MKCHLGKDRVRSIFKIFAELIIIRNFALCMKNLFTFLVICLTLIPNILFAGNFTRGNENACKFGVHEITLTGDGSVSNPFDTPCELTFTPPSGSSNSIVVNAFYDGANTWRARCYVNEVGEWSWVSSASNDYGLDDKGGSFIALDSNLKGKLKTHPQDNKALATDDGKWFLNIGDTPYYLFHDIQSKWQEFIRDSWNKGITLLRASMVGSLRDWDRLFDNGNHDKLDIGNFQTNDERLIWMLDNYSDMFVEFILFGETNTGYAGDETLWYNMTGVQHRRILKYIVARYAAFPEIIWEVVNDYKYDSSHPNNVAMANEVGNYLMDNDPWNHIITTGGIRGNDFYFSNAVWAGLVHLETLDALSADQVHDYENYPLHVFNAEDRYETYKEPDYPKIYFRRLIWSWTLSGGSACYGGDWDAIVPYSQSSFEGLDNIIHVKNFFIDTGIELAGYISDDNCVTSGARGNNRPKVMRNQSKSSYVIYHPNASIDGQAANISSSTASLTINDLSIGEYTALWMRADDAVKQRTVFDHIGGDKLLTSPWPGIDVVLSLQINPAVDVELSPVLSKSDTVSLSVYPNPFDIYTTIYTQFSENTEVRLDIFNIHGKHIEKLVDGKFSSGNHQFIWNAEDHPSGIYFIKLVSGSKVFSRGLILM